jgi:hypothetical protein
MLGAILIYIRQSLMEILLSLSLLYHIIIYTRARRNQSMFAKGPRRTTLQDHLASYLLKKMKIILCINGIPKLFYKFAERK